MSAAAYLFYITIKELSAELIAEEYIISGDDETETVAALLALAED